MLHNQRAVFRSGKLSALQNHHLSISKMPLWIKTGRVVLLMEGVAAEGMDKEVENRGRGEGREGQREGRRDREAEGGRGE